MGSRSRELIKLKRLNTFAVNGEERIEASFRRAGLNTSAQLLILKIAGQFRAAPLYCPVSGKPLRRMPINDNGDILCPERHNCSRRHECRAACLVAEENDDLFLVVDRMDRLPGDPELEQKITILQREVEALEAANEAQGAQVLTSLSQMEEVLHEVDQRRRELEAKDKDVASLNQLVTRITDAITDILIMTGPDGLIQRVNAKGQKYFGRSEKDLLGLSPDILLESEELMLLQSTMPPRTWTRRPVLYDAIYYNPAFEKEVTLRHNLDQEEDGQERVHLLRGAILYDGTGKEEGMLLLAHDISSVKKREMLARDRDMAKALGMLESTIANIGQAVAVFDEDFKLKVWNDLYFSLMDLDPAMAEAGTPFSQIVQAMTAKLQKTGGVQPEDLPHKAYFWEFALKDDRRMEVYSNPMPHGGFVMVYRDITERRQKEDDLRKFSYAVEQSPSEIVITDTDGIVEYVNQKFTENTGYTPEEVVGQRPALVQSGDMANDFYADMWNTIKAGHEWRGEVLNKRKNGEKFWQFLAISPIRDRNDQISHFLAIKEDITDQKHAEERLRFQARHDALTNLPNRTLFQEKLVAALDRTKDGETEAALLWLDLDSFKDVNDTLGHDVGDRLLQAVARRLRGCTRECEMVARLGGDEFAIIIDGLQEREEAARLASRVLETLHRPFRISGQLIQTGCSIGITIVPQDGETIDTVLKNADVALYRSKSDGGNTFRFFDLSMYYGMQRRKQVEAGLSVAIDNDELLLLYQPKIDLRTGALSGTEALIRWNHPEWGVTPPNEFIEIAEQNGQIIPIGEWVINEACRQMRRWLNSNSPVPRVAVNLSPVQLRHPKLVDVIRKALDDNNLHAEYLELEITETAALSDLDHAVNVLTELQELGVGLSLDDFGTGYSSLSYLYKLPVDTIKVDRTFIINIGQNEEATNFAHGIVQFGHVVGKRLLAEGVEDITQLALLRDWQCDEAQGYYFARPLSAEDLDQFLNKGNPSFEI